MKIKNIIFSWDLIISLFISAIVLCFLPKQIPVKLSKDLYGVGISVLSIVFSVFFAALAIIMTAGDNKFVKFLEEEGDYRRIVDTYKITLLILFIALIYSIIIYGFTSLLIAKEVQVQNKCYLVIFTFLFGYGLFASVNSTLDSIKYAQYRARFISITK